MNEPHPVDESVPDSVLDELKRAFDSPSPADAAAVVGSGQEHDHDHDAAHDHRDAGHGDAALDDAAHDAPVDALVDAPAEAAVESTGNVVGAGLDDVAAEAPVAISIESPAADADLQIPVPADEHTARAVPPEERTTIVIADEDQLPDLRYLDELTDANERSASIVIGDDLDSSGAFDAVALPSRSMDPRVRERRIAVKRERGRRRLIIVASIAAVIVVVVSVLAILASSLFSVEVVEVQGAPYTSARHGEELQAVIDSLLGEPVLLVDTEAARRSLEEIPWVERAFVTTDFPDRVLIDIRERQPLATFAGSDLRWRVIDRDGRVLDVLDGQPVDYMSIEGLTPDSEPGQLAGTPFALGAQLVAALPAEIRQITEAITVDAASGDFGLRLQGPIDVRLGGFDRMDTKLARLLQQVRDGLEGITGIDLATDEIAVTSS